VQGAAGGVGAGELDEDLDRALPLAGDLVEVDRGSPEIGLTALVQDACRPRSALKNGCVGPARWRAGLGRSMGAGPV
jgi:hypothetical protein